MATDYEIRKEALEKLQELVSRGALTPDNVVKAARSKNSPLHDFFEWDDTKAAHQHRIEQARVLIRSVKVIITTKETVLEAPRYVHDPRAGNTQGYVETLSIKGNLEVARDAIMAELKRAVASLKRANEIAGALNMQSEISGMIEELLKLQHVFGVLFEEQVIE